MGRSMTEKRKVKIVARLRRHYQFGDAEPWHLAVLRSMEHWEQRLFAEELDHCAIDTLVKWRVRTEFFLHCPDRIMRWRAIWWSNLDGFPNISYVRQMKAPGDYLMTNFDDTQLFEYDPYEDCNDNRRPALH